MKSSEILFLLKTLIIVSLIFIIGCQASPGGGGNSGPNRPALPFPESGDTDVPIDVDLSWDCTDPDGDIIDFDVYFGTTSPPEIVLSFLNEPTYDPGILENSTTYYWRIRASDRYSEPVSGAEWWFTTGTNQLPNIPSDEFPEDDATNVPIDVDLSWTCTDPDGDELTYNVYFGTSYNNLQLVSAGQSQTTYDPGILETGTVYHWRIVAIDPFDASTSGPEWLFYTGNDQGIFAELHVLRYAGYYDATVYYDDQIAARFDSSYAPEYPLQSLQVESVDCNQYQLAWEDLVELYRYRDPINDPFIQLSHNYVFGVVGNDVVPDLVDSVTFPDCSPYITNITEEDTLSFNGFDVEWDGYCGGYVRFVIMDYTDSTGVDFETENDGSYSFTSSDLDPLDNIPGVYYMYMILQNSRSITTGGFDPRSVVKASSINNVGLHIE
jgi:hypothetical protein